MARAIVIVLDSFGIGAAADADKFGDVGADTFGHIAEHVALQGKGLAIPNLMTLGLGEAYYGATGEQPAGISPAAEILGKFGWAQELSSGKDTPSGHWEMAGVPVLFDWGYFLDQQNSFPAELLEQLIEHAELPGILGNCHASGTTIIQNLGAEHMQSGKPIVYTSADSVLQIAAHEQSFGLQRLYQVCELARELLEPYNIGRVIARPFTGSDASNFVRTGNRRDYAVPPPAPTLLDKLSQAGGEVISIGKIADIFAHQGITQKYKATGIEALMAKTLEVMTTAPEQSLIFTNLVDFDSDFGHRRNPQGYAQALELFDQLLPQITAQMQPDDILILTADHGCDPTWPGSDHTREYVPVLAYGAQLAPGSIGRRETFADIGQSLAELFGLEPMAYGRSFLKE
ncbi:MULTISPECIES: phosphopentomutase [Idiomarina]|uniref:phosphopentomutase n=1 Tax=Idiomarina TaxID=135575 RepID=UPI00129A77BA|nr:MULTISPECIES: phosphopentomutase [Idiomarina]MRJ41762.1 phosphopentomutase [Idiomarina sp. FeN1]NCU57752.1 phosphopentomutase [Idiomarina sp. FenA--70]NCU60304.1 phosphopentomutase [Idiomarina sp. FenBw--71]UUN13862.1 phosphopentomutase [Idiomarina loihiensis]